MNPALHFWRSTIGKKVVMAVTGLIGIGFLISHVASNLSVFGAPEKLDAYAHFLRTLGPLLWIARGVLLAAVILHVVAAVQLTRRNVVARPVDYRKRAPQVSTLGARTLRWGGAILFAFILFHLADLTWGWVTPGFEHLKPSQNMGTSLRRWPVAVFYIIAMISLGLHLYHGAWSSMRTLGAAKPGGDPLRRVLPVVIAVAVAGGFAAIPLAYLAGFLR